jgi:hypothetical protein
MLRVGIDIVLFIYEKKYYYYTVLASGDRHIASYFCLALVSVPSLDKGKRPGDPTRCTA